MVTTTLLGAAYLVFAALCMRATAAKLRFAGLAVCNLAALPALLAALTTLKAGLFAWCTYVTMVLCHYLTLRLFARSEGRSWLALVSPVVMLVALNHLGWLWDPLWTKTSLSQTTSLAALYVGLSYMGFRLSYLALEVGAGKTEVPDVWRYLSFAFFLPTLVSGPISPYSLFEGSVANPQRELTPIARSLFRLLVGAVKYLVLGSMLNKLGYRELLLDGHRHAPVDLVVAAFAYYGYLYCNFAGFSDMAIGAGGLLGVRVHENFNRPYLARNIRDFWNRWHITLGVYMRDMVFSPMSKSLARRFGPRHINKAIALSVLTVFILVGVWHGVGIRYALFGLLHGLAAVGNHYYDVFLKARLGREGYRRYQANGTIRVLAIALTLLFVAATLMLFAVDVDGVVQLISVIEV